MFPLISVQILNWNRAIETQRAIQSALDQTYPNIEIIIIDNGSTDNSVELTKLNFPQLNVVELSQNYGCPDGRNRGIDYCTGEYIFYLDNDGVLHQDAIMNAYLTISSDEDIAVVTGVVYDFDDSSEIDTKCDIVNKDRYVFNNFQGGISMHRKIIYDSVGRYPSHFRYGAEEFYLTLKLFETDYKIIKDESVVLWHRRGDVARDRTSELLNSYYNKLNTKISLFPFFPALLFSLYFIPAYSKYSFREGILIYFLRSIPKRFWSTIRLGIEKRNPMSKTSYHKFKNFKKTSIKLK